MKHHKFVLTTFIVIICCTIACKFTNNKHAQGPLSFQGTWGVDSPIVVNNLLEIKNDTTEFNVIENQLSLKCRNAYDHDTLLLYIADVDCGREFQGPPFYTAPKINSLFAKCYIQDNEIHISYEQKLFNDRIRELQLSTIAYRNDDDDQK